MHLLVILQQEIKSICSECTDADKNKFKQNKINETIRLMFGQVGLNVTCVFQLTVILMTKTGLVVVKAV
jgi:hypothetical protein